MGSRTYFIIAATGFILLFIFYILTGNQSEETRTTQEVLEELPVLSFSNTQDWDESLVSILDSETYPGFEEKSFELPPPPGNYSEETSAELQILHEYQDLRTPEKIAEINNEINALDARFGSSTLREIALNRPTTTKLLDLVLDTTEKIILEQKEHFDRVRPSHLDTTLTTAIEVPGHPAYPSGHSTQAHLLAEALSAVNPDQTATYFQSAARIAKNREIAGIHYPSDSVAGRLLSEQIFPVLERDQLFQSLLDGARAEWASSTESSLSITSSSTTSELGENSSY